jgi:hypothetical protein
MKAIFIALLILANFSLTSHAKSLELKKKSHSIFISEKTGWTLGKELFGMPFVYFSPQKNGQRSNISFTDTAAELELDIKSLATTQEKYQTSRKKWAQTVGANVLGFLPYEVSVSKHGHKIHRIGVSYEHQGKSYAEKSYYIECRGKIIYSKALRLTQNEVHDKDFSDLISGLDCGGI